MDQKRVKRTQNIYLANRWSKKLGRPLTLIRKIMFLLVFHIFHISQITGSAQKCPNEVKMDQKSPKWAKIFNSRTFGRKNLVDPSFESVISCFNDSLISILYFSDDRKCSKCANRHKRDQNLSIWDQKRLKGAKRGPMEQKSIFHEPLVVENW